MKFLIVGDLHGNMPKIHYKNFDAIIAPGDFCGDSYKPYIFQAMRENMKDPKRDLSWSDLVGKSKATKMVKESLKKGRDILEMLNSIGAPVYVVPGNWDYTGKGRADLDIEMRPHWKELKKGLNNIYDCHRKLLDGLEVSLIGTGITSGPEYPQYKEDLDRIKPRKLEKMRRDLDSSIEKLSKLFEKSYKPAVFISHNVPFNTSMDKITNKNSPKYGYHYGSVLAREIVEKYQPVVCIGGHMHEHFGKDKIGRTICINSGFGSNVNVLLEVVGDKVKKVEFWDGKKLKK